ncbi:MAG: TolC family protein [Bacteroidetes bacterium]|nr:TolC family protein [Bacteroidota bacterium]
MIRFIKYYKSFVSIFIVSAGCWLFVTNSFGQTILTLDRAFGIAMTNSPDIRRSMLNLERSRESLNAQNAALKSNFSLSLTPVDYNLNRNYDDFAATWYTDETKRSFGTFTIAQPIKLTDATLSLNNRLSWQDTHIETAQTTRNNKSFSNNLFLSLNQPLFTYNRTKLQLRELELDLENATLQNAIQKLNIEKNVTQGFYNVYQNQMSLQIAREEFENMQQSYEIIKNKVEAGLSAMEELYQAELNLATSKSNYQNQQVLLDNSKDAFKQLIGLSLFEEITVLANVTHEPIHIDLEKAIEYGLSNRMELRQREIDIENSQFDLVRTSAMNEFKGDMSVSVGLFGDNEQFGDIYETPTKNPQVSLSFSIPLWDWGEKKSRIKATEANIKTRELSHEDERNNIIISIRTVYRNLQNLENQIEIARQNEKNAQLTYEINLERYKNGDLTSMDLNLFQAQLSEKKTALAKSLVDYKMELLNMKIQSLWDFEKNQPYLALKMIK